MACVLTLIPMVFLGYTYYVMSKETSERIQRGAIDRVINSESPVYYSDGRTPIGVFFEKNHSKYIKYDEIPKIFVKALIAAEDKNFFDHSGFDPKSIVRAFVVNIKSGRVVQGGSTLTQQTAKNISNGKRDLIGPNSGKCSRPSFWKGNTPRKKYWKCTPTSFL